MNLLKKLFGKTKPPTSVSASPAQPPQSEPEPEPLQIKEILPDELNARLDNGNSDLVVVDMRHGWEYQSGHIQNAIHMFVQEIPHRFNELPQDKDVVFQCWHGNTSLNASAFLIQNGWNPERVYSLSGGMAGWASLYGVESLYKED
jgi:rhodanese-related sulfurtransferase